MSLCLIGDRGLSQHHRGSGPQPTPQGIGASANTTGDRGLIQHHRGSGPHPTPQGIGAPINTTGNRDLSQHHRYCSSWVYLTLGYVMTVSVVRTATLSGSLKPMTVDLNSWSICHRHPTHHCTMKASVAFSDQLSWERRSPGSRSPVRFLAQGNSFDFGIRKSTQRREG